jgi:Kdo2-lipid IVA lauroyltransferase/acyltransferase
LLGVVAGDLLRIRRVHVTNAMASAGIPSPQKAASRMYASLGRGLVELLWMAGRPRDTEGIRVVFGGASAARLEHALLAGRGVVVATAHTGNWDLTACAAARWLKERTGEAANKRVLHVVTKRLSWRALDRLWQRLRVERGIELVETHGAVRRVREALGAGHVVAMMVDQVPERASGFAVFPFLGRPARHDLAPVTLAARAGAPVVVAFGVRAAGGHHVLEVVDVLLPSANREAIVRATEQIARSLETFIQAHPDQWLWLHRRWKPRD